MLSILRSDRFQSAVDQLPGYQVNDSGRVLELGAAFEALRVKPAAKPRR